MAASSMIEDVSHYLEDIPLESSIKDELTACMQDIVAIETGLTHQIPQDKLLEFVGKLQKVGEVVVKLFDMAKSFGFIKHGVALTVISTVLGKVLAMDIASLLIKPFKKIIPDSFETKCRATCRKIIYCVRYVQNMPSNLRDDNEKRHLLQMLSSEFPLHDAITNVLELGDKIKEIVKQANTDVFNELMVTIELYCSLTTYTELFLLYRLVAFKRYGTDSSPIEAVLQEHRKTDREVLIFLHKPNVRTVQLYIKCYLGDWPILLSFVCRRGIFPESLAEISGKRYVLSPVKKPNLFLCHSKNLDGYLQFLESDSTKFKLTHKGRNIFTIQTSSNRYVAAFTFSISVSNAEPSEESREWYVLKIHPELPTEPAMYMIWLATDRCRCFGYSFFGLQSSWWSKPGQSYMWRFHPV